MKSWGEMSESKTFENRKGVLIIKKPFMSQVRTHFDGVL